MVYPAAGLELAFIEAHAIVEQQFYVAHHEFAAVLVDRAGQFGLDFCDAIGEYLPFVVGEVQRLGRFVGEE